MTSCFQFIDGPPSASPDVLLDLDDNAPFFVAAGASISPPKVRRSTVQGLGDGSVETGSSFEDRVIRLPLGVKKVSAEEQSTAIQELNRIIARPAWLKVHAPGMAEPRFYRTRRADVDVIDDIFDARPDRTLLLELLAEPGARGLPETIEFEIANDPTAAVNPLMYTFGEILGDMMSDLHLTFPVVDAAHRVVWASEARFDGTTQTEPYWKSLSEAAKKTTGLPASWTINDTPDASMISGTKRTVTHTSTTDPDFLVPTQQQLLVWEDLPPQGDYRVMVRLVGVNAGMKLYFWNQAPSVFNVLLEEEAAASASVVATETTGHDWYDLGIVSMPGGAPISDVVHGLDDEPTPALWNFGHRTSVSGEAVDYDTIVLVPAGRPDTVTRHGSAEFNRWFLSKTAVLDGVNNRRYSKGSWFGTVAPTKQAPAAITGALPVVVPGASNTLTLFVTASIDTPVPLDVDVDDSKATTTVVVCTYLPTYVYDRPAMT